jgi:RNA polymerase sigma-B factor
LPAIENNLEEVLNREVIAGLLERLRPRQRQILHLRFFEELSQAQIAEKIGTSQVHVGRLIASSLLELRGHLREDAAGSV